MDLKLPAKLQQYVQDKLRSGEFARLEELLIKSLSVMRNVEEAIPASQDDLRREIDLGIQDLDEGRAAELDIEEMKRELVHAHKARAKGRKAS